MVVRMHAMRFVLLHCFTHVIVTVPLTFSTERCLSPWGVLRRRRRRLRGQDRDVWRAFSTCMQGCNGEEKSIEQGSQASGTAFLFLSPVPVYHPFHPADFTLRITAGIALRSQPWCGPWVSLIPFTSTRSPLASVGDVLQLIGDVLQAWLQAWRGPPMQRRLEPRVWEVLAAGKD
jgi:hypothetical protein